VLDGRDLPGDVHRVADAGVETVATPRRVDVRALADQEDPAVGEPVGDQHPGCPRIGRQHLVLHRLARQPGDQLGRVRRAVCGGHPGDDRPPGAGQVQPAEQAGRGGPEHPVLDGRAEAGVQGRRTEHDVEVGPGIGIPGVAGADLVPDQAGRAVAAEHVARGDLVGGAGRVADGPRNPVRPLGERGHRVAEPQAGGGLVADMRAQHLFHHGLGYLLAAFGEPVVALAGQPERVGEIGDARPGQRLAEGDALRPGHWQRRGGAQHMGHAPAAQVLHGPHAGGLGPRPAVGDRDPGLDDHAADAVQAQFGGGRQASWAAAGDQHGGALGARHYPAAPWAGGLGS
jgi:hypothetical protein